MLHSPHICMLAAENDVIPGAKVGGIGDVLRDIPKALAGNGAQVSVIIPAYNAFHLLPEAKLIDSATVAFANKNETVQLFELYAGRDSGVRYLVLQHELLGACGAGSVYCNDVSDRPFATDANKFALFCAGALQLLVDGAVGEFDVLHLHDWHAGFASILREFDPRFASLKTKRCVFSIHNLALQGIRPLEDDESSLTFWYPDLQFTTTTIVDPRWPNCVNPVAASIRLADKVHTVSPSYSLEIIRANAPRRGFHGGEGLERDLQQCAARNDLVGITNGIDYDTPVKQRIDWPALMTSFSDIILKWLGESATINTADYLAHQRTQQWLKEERPQHILTSVGRLTDQKMALLLAETSRGNTVLDELLENLKGSGVLILLGSGDTELEAICRRSASLQTNFMFLNRYDQTLSDLIFANGDVFLMPSSFEPCGISQMLAMRQAQPCIVHAVGGLRDTVSDMQDGFHFDGDSVSEQVQNFQLCTNKVLDMREHKPKQFQHIAQAAQQKRFYWSDSAKQYLTELYA